MHRRQNLKVALLYFEDDVEGSCFQKLSSSSDVKTEGNAFTFEAMDETEHSPEFLYLLHHIGWEVDITEFSGYKGGIEPPLKAETMRYFADMCTELVFHVPTLMKVDTLAARQYKQNLITNDSVAICWVEDKDLFARYKSSARVTIAVFPLPSEMYRISVITSVRDHPPLPTHDHALSPPCTLTMVRRERMSRLVPSAATWLLAKRFSPHAFA